VAAVELLSAAVTAEWAGARHVKRPCAYITCSTMVFSPEGQERIRGLNAGTRWSEAG